MFTRYFTVWLLRMHTIADFFFFPTSPLKRKYGYLMLFLIFCLKDMECVR